MSLAGELKEIVGSELFSTLADKFTNSTIYFCRIPRSRTHKVVLEIIGEDLYKKAASHFLNRTIYFPKGIKKQAEDRNRDIVDDFDDGLMVLDIVDKYGLSNRQVRTIINRARKMRGEHVPRHGAGNRNNSRNLHESIRSAALEGASFAYLEGWYHLTRRAIKEICQGIADSGAVFAQEAADRERMEILTAYQSGIASSQLSVMFNMPLAQISGIVKAFVPATGTVRGAHS